MAATTMPARPKPHEMIPHLAALLAPALRILGADEDDVRQRIREACGLPPSAAVVTADTAWRMMGKRDPHVNVVRTTIAVVAAAFGGADAVTVLPFTLPLGLPDRFARRMARNTQLVLIEEASLAAAAQAQVAAEAALVSQLAQAGIDEARLGLSEDLS